MPEGEDVAADIIKGIYKLESVLKQKAKAKAKSNVQLMGSGTILNEVRKAAQILSED